MEGLRDSAIGSTLVILTFVSYLWPPDKSMVLVRTPLAIVLLLLLCLEPLDTISTPLL